MKRTIDFAIDPSNEKPKLKKRRRYKYQLINEEDSRGNTNRIIVHPDGEHEYLDGESVPFLYIKDRLATDKQINELNRVLNLRRTIFEDLPKDTKFMLDTLTNARFRALKTIIYGHIDNNKSVDYIYEEIDAWLDLLSDEQEAEEN